MTKREMRNQETKPKHPFLYAIVLLILVTLLLSFLVFLTQQEDGRDFNPARHDYAAVKAKSPVYEMQENIALREDRAFGYSSGIEATGEYVKNISLELEAKELKQSHADVLAEIEGVKGVVEWENINVESIRPELWLSVKIPAKDSTKFLNKLEKLMSVKSTTQRLDNVEDRLMYLESELEWLGKKEKKLLKLLDKAEEIEDIIQIENEITSTQQQLKWMLKDQENLKKEVAYDTFNLHITQAEAYTEKSFTETVQDEFDRGVVAFENFLKSLVLFFSFYFFPLASLLLIFAIGVAVFALNKALKNRKRLSELARRKAKFKAEYYETLDKMFALMDREQLIEMKKEIDSLEEQDYVEEVDDEYIDLIDEE